MLRHAIISAILLACAHGLVAEALAELPAQTRESASHIVTGTVAKVFARDRGEASELVDYLIQIRVDGVEKGKDCRQGDAIYAHAFRRKPGARKDLPGVGGHRGIPEEGQRIRAWLKYTDGELGALYPKWFEVLQPSDQEQPKGSPMSSASKTMPRLYRVIHPVTDIEQAAKLYGDLLGSKGERVSPERHYFNCGGTILACYDSKADGDGPAAPPRYQQDQYIYIAVPDLEAIYAKAKELGFKDREGGIKSMPWGERLFWANDPFGNPVSFVAAGTEFFGSAD